MSVKKKSCIIFCYVTDCYAYIASCVSETCIVRCRNGTIDYSFSYT